MWVKEDLEREFATLRPRFATSTVFALLQYLFLCTER